MVATPSGITLSPEGGAHQSIAQPLIGMAQDGLASFEPAFVDELAVILRFAFDYIQKDGDAAASERNWLRDETGGSVYLRLSTRPIEQPQRAMTDELKQGIVDGAYWLRKPGPNAQVVVAYTGAIAPEAIQAVGLMAEDRRDIGLLAVTSADRLNAGWTAAQRARERGLRHARSHDRAAARRRASSIAGSSPCSTDIRRHYPGSARCTATRARARRRAFRPDRFAAGPVPALRHRFECDHRSGAGTDGRPPDPVSEGAALMSCHGCAAPGTPKLHTPNSKNMMAAWMIASANTMTNAITAMTMA